jgi:hypothetical protein
MQFDAREIKPYSIPVPVNELEIGSVYFKIFYVNNDLLNPIMETVVFIGRDLDLDFIDKDSDFDDKVKVHFQDYESYARGIRFETFAKGDEAIFFCHLEDEFNGVFEFERALDLLMWCSLKRRGLNET